MSYLLLIETSNTVCSVAVAKENSLIIELNEEAAFAHAEKLAPMVSDAIQRAGILPSDLAAIAVSSGPGSYTGLRIGVSLAKGMCFSLGIPLIAVNSLQAIVRKMQRVKPEYVGKFRPMVDARRMEVFTALFDESGNLISQVEPVVLTQEVIEKWSELPCMVGGDGETKFLQLNPPSEFTPSNVTTATAKNLLVDAWQKFQASDFEDVAYFEPAYSKEFYMPSKV